MKFLVDEAQTEAELGDYTILSHGGSKHVSTTVRYILGGQSLAAIPPKQEPP
jgi:hypothetical protein